MTPKVETGAPRKAAAGPAAAAPQPRRKAVGGAAREAAREAEMRRPLDTEERKRLGEKIELLRRDLVHRVLSKKINGKAVGSQGGTPCALPSFFRGRQLRLQRNSAVTSLRIAYYSTSREVGGGMAATKLLARRDSVCTSHTSVPLRTLAAAADQLH